MDWWWGVGMLGAALSIAFSVLLVVLIAVAIVKLLGSRPGGMTGRGSSGLRVLDELYARGEITRDQYLERKTVLKR